MDPKNDMLDFYEYYSKLDMDQYTQYCGYLEQLEDLEEEEVESSEKVSRRYIARERELAEEKLRRDYFGDENTPPIYPEEYFRRRKPTLEDVQHVYDLHERKHGLSGMLESIDCMHWEWVKCPKALHGQFKRKDKRYPTIMLEAVVDQQLWFWHAYFGVPGANNGLNVLYGSLLFDDLLAEKAPEALFQVNGKTYEKCYYLADGIYPQWSTFVKAFSIARDQKTIKFKRVQESARKDIERAFGVLQGRWGIIQQPARAYHMNTIRRIMYTCMILHNMILKDQNLILVNIGICTLLQRATFNKLGSNDANDNEGETKNFEIGDVQRNVGEIYMQVRYIMEEEDEDG
ncbi:zinc finger, CCHC-type containing protein [Tanacetum coccineum]